MLWFMTLDDFPPMHLVERPLDPKEPGWLYENKFDGYRMTALFGETHCELRTRDGANATRWFSELWLSLSGGPGGPHIVDGEVCVLDDFGRSDFDRLQDRARLRCWGEGCDEVVYCIFDLPCSRGTT